MTLTDLTEHPRPERTAERFDPEALRWLARLDRRVAACHRAVAAYPFTLCPPPTTRKWSTR